MPDNEDEVPAHDIALSPGMRESRNGKGNLISAG